MSGCGWYEDVVGTKTWLVRRRGLSSEDGVYKDVVERRRCI